MNYIPVGRNCKSLTTRTQSNSDTWGVTNYLTSSHFVKFGNIAVLGVAGLSDRFQFNHPYILEKPQNRLKQCECSSYGAPGTFCMGCRGQMEKPIIYMSNLYRNVIAKEKQVLHPMDGICRGSILSIQIQLVDRNLVVADEPDGVRKMTYFFKIQIKHVSGDRCSHYKLLQSYSIANFLEDIITLIGAGMAARVGGEEPQDMVEWLYEESWTDLTSARPVNKFLELKDIVQEASGRPFVNMQTVASLSRITLAAIFRSRAATANGLNMALMPDKRVGICASFNEKYINTEYIHCIKLFTVQTRPFERLKLFCPGGSADFTLSAHHCA